MVRVAVIGAAGYTGIEAVRWVLSHPDLELTCATSTTDAGRLLAEVYPSLAGLTSQVFETPEAESIASVADVVLLAVPHTAALGLAPSLLERGLTVVDLSADFRLADSGVYESWYETSHAAPHLLEQAVYGLPELDRSRLPGARLVACPGCYPTATTLAALPALRSGAWAGGPVFVDAKSGVSGAGRTPAAATHFVAAHESLMPYKVGVHRHTPEIEQALGTGAGAEVRVLFVPHLVPMSRGLLSTVYLAVEPGYTTADALAAYGAFYAQEPFVHVHAQGAMPSTAEVRATNRAAIGVHVDERTATLAAVCAIDNLGKGAAGQAIQCLNAVLGLPETTGLDAPLAVV